MGRVMMRFICLHGVETFRRKWNELKIGILIFRGHDVTLLLARSKEKLVYLVQQNNFISESIRKTLLDGNTVVLNLSDLRFPL